MPRSRVQRQGDGRVRGCLVKKEHEFKHTGVVASTFFINFRDGKTVKMRATFPPPPSPARAMLSPRDLFSPPASTGKVHLGDDIVMLNLPLRFPTPPSINHRASPPSTISAASTTPSSKAPALHRAAETPHNISYADNSVGGTAPRLTSHVWGATSSARRPSPS